MHITLALALTVFGAGVPLPGDDDDPAAVVLRLWCPNARDLAACKRLFDHPEVIGKAVQCYWVSDLHIIKQQKDPRAWLKRHLRVNTSGGDTIRISISGNIPRRDRAALANAVFYAWAPELGGSVRETMVDVAAERRAFDKAQKRLDAAHQRIRDAERAPRQDGPAGKLARVAAVQAAVAECRALRPDYEAAQERFGEAARRRPFVIAHLARGPHPPYLETMGRPPHGP
jgi:hypothetical protein